MTTSRVVVFGAGDAGRKAIATLDASVQVLAVSDNDAGKHGRFLAGHEIVSPGRIAALEPDAIVVASMYWREIVDQLAKLGFSGERVTVHSAARGGAGGLVATAPERVAGAAVPEWMRPRIRAIVTGKTKSAPLVSIVLPTRNRAGVLPRAIESVLAQRYRKFELLIVDDGSTDRSATVLRKYAARDARVRILRQPPTGVSAARNRGLAAARGQLVAYIDSDNRWHPDYLALMVTGFADRHRKTGYSGFNVFDLQSGYFRAIVTPFDYERLRELNWIDLNTFMHRRSLVAEQGGFDEKLTRLVDWDLILRYTRIHPPFVVGCALADYYHDPALAHITVTEPFKENRARITQAVSHPPIRGRRRRGSLRVAYVQTEFPVVSQTFVQEEVARLLDSQVEVSVLHFRDAFARAKVPSDWDVAKFSNREELAWQLMARQIDLVHTHFAMPHPANFIIPVCERLELPFTIKPHAFDIFRRDHDRQHHISLTGAHRLCRAVLCIGEYHRQFLRDEGVPAEKLVVIRNIFAVDAFFARRSKQPAKVTRLLALSRFVEKKGFHVLIPAFRQLPDPDLRRCPACGIRLVTRMAFRRC
jgi:glycosyltransferase involved in cell wall biosynthesis